MFSHCSCTETENFSNLGITFILGDRCLSSKEAIAILKMSSWLWLILPDARSPILYFHKLRSHRCEVDLFNAVQASV